MKVKYTFLEAEQIEKDYDEQVPLQVIAENVNRDFHQGQPVRTTNSVKYVIQKIHGDDDWYEKLEEEWMNIERPKGYDSTEKS